MNVWTNSSQKRSGMFLLPDLPSVEFVEPQGEIARASLFGSKNDGLTPFYRVQRSLWSAGAKAGRVGR